MARRRHFLPCPMPGAVKILLKMTTFGLDPTRRQRIILELSFSAPGYQWLAPNEHYCYLHHYILPRRPTIVWKYHRYAAFIYVWRGVASRESVACVSSTRDPGPQTHKGFIFVCKPSDMRGTHLVSLRTRLSPSA